MISSLESARKAMTLCRFILDGSSDTTEVKEAIKVGRPLVRESIKDVGMVHFLLETFKRVADTSKLSQIIVLRSDNLGENVGLLFRRRRLNIGWTVDAVIELTRRAPDERRKQQKR